MHLSLLFIIKLNLTYNPSNIPPIFTNWSLAATPIISLQRTSPNSLQQLLSSTNSTTIAANFDLPDDWWECILTFLKDDDKHSSLLEVSLHRLKTITLHHQLSPILCHYMLSNPPSPLSKVHQNQLLRPHASHALPRWPQITSLSNLLLSIEPHTRRIKN